MTDSTTTDYGAMSTVELRKLAKDSHPVLRGQTWKGISKDDLVELLSGNTTAEALLEGSGKTPPTVSTTPTNNDDLATVIAQAISGKVNAGVDEDAVKAIFHEELDAKLEEATKSLSDRLNRAIKALENRAGTHIHMPEMKSGPVEVDGVAHRQLPQVLAWMRADVPLWLWGAPGAGKTHLARQLADCLGIRPFVMSIDETTTANKLLGFQNLVSGEFVKGWLYEPYKNGGLVLIDEIDTGNPGVLAGLNALIANGHYMFPNGETVERHKDFRVIAAANTNGTGATAGFTARQRLDAATLNRFGVVEFLYDEGLELQLTCGTKSDSTPWKPVEPASDLACINWVNWVQDVRKAFGHAVLISPRASILGCRALRAGVPVSEVADALVLALCAKDTKTAIIDKCGDPKELASQRKVA